MLFDLKATPLDRLARLAGSLRAQHGRLVEQGMAGDPILIGVWRGFAVELILEVDRRIRKREPLHPRVASAGWTDEAILEALGRAEVQAAA